MLLSPCDTEMNEGAGRGSGEAGRKGPGRGSGVGRGLRQGEGGLLGVRGAWERRIIEGKGSVGEMAGRGGGWETGG